MSKLGIDTHSKWYWVDRQLDRATPQAMQKMEIDGPLHFVAKQQGLINLLDNAIKFSPQGGSVRVTLSSDPRRAPILQVLRSIFPVF